MLTNYLVMLLTLVGTIANALGKRWSFGIWLGTNAYWALYNGLNNDIPQCLIFIANIVVCIFAINGGYKDNEKFD